VTFAEPPAYVDEDTGKNIAMFSSLGYAWVRIEAVSCSNMKTISFH
jgi:hypothetical protein